MSIKALALVWFGGVVVCAQAQTNPALRAFAGLAAVDSMTAAEFAKDSVGSITVGVVIGDSLVWTRSLGYADMNSRRLANRNTIYRIGSVTKALTGVMLLQLVDRGKLDLFDEVAQYVPEFRQVKGLPARVRPATIMQIATMTAGLPVEPPDVGPFRTGPAGEWEAKLLASLPHVTFTHAPGTHFAYSNLGYAVLATALERAARTPYLEWQRREILGPLKMQHTWFDYEPAMAANLAAGYEVKEDGTIDTLVPARELRTGRGYKIPVGGIFTTVDDLARFVAFELGHGPSSVLPRSRLDSAFNGVVGASLEMDMGYGLGFMAQRRGNFPWVGHSGGVPGYTAMMYFERDHDVGVIVFRNATGGNASIGRLAPDLLRTLIDAKIAEILKRERPR